MSLLEQEAFIKGIPPFDTLSGKNLEYVCQNLDVVYFKEDEQLMIKGTEPEFLYFIIKGVVQEIEENEVVSIYDHHEFFDPISLIENHVKHTFVTVQETICYLLPRAIFLEVLHEDKNFEQYFFQTISQKLNVNHANEKNKELANFMVARVRDAYVQTPVIVDATTSIYDAVKALKEQKSNSLLVRRDNELGIVTDTDYREKFILEKMSADSPIGDLAKYNLIYIEGSEFLFNAQLEMTKHGIKRLVVIDENKEVIGVLDQISLASFFASHTYAISNEIEKAESVGELQKASTNLIRITQALYGKGVKVRYISKLLSQLNEKIFKKLFELTAPEALLEKSALIVMGSEGRREQILKTDQDNALILSDDCTIDTQTLETFTLEFTDRLISFGYPACPGNIMISNPEWVHTESDFKKLLFSWIDEKNSDNFMNLAIFYDALTIVGDEKLLDNLKRYLSDKIENSGAFYSHFANAVLSFETPLSIFAGFVLGKNEHKDELDIKKGGIFPIVHGVRSLSMEHKIEETNSVERLKKLNDLGVLDRELTGDLIESFTFLLTLRLKLNLEKIDKNIDPDNYIKPSQLTKLEKDLLKDSFKTVDKFKKFLTFHYKLNMLG
ncbi:MAG: CBS domain-containing protein [Epsilonproteobacteria bacterium]|nr:CBS domain-containing protein [Campylobacterota bacterium]